MPGVTAVAMRINGDLVDDGRVVIDLSPDAPATFTVHLRMPAWSAQTRVRLKNEAWMPGRPGQWLVINRCWRPGDQLEMEFDMHVRVERFDADRIGPDQPVVKWHEKEWAAMGMILEEGASQNIQQKSSLHPSDALRHGPAAMLFRGPLALARDMRLGGDDVFKPLPASFLDSGQLAASQAAAPEGIWKAYEVSMDTGPVIRCCDFASAGNTWDRGSRFNSWITTDTVKKHEKGKKS